MRATKPSSIHASGLLHPVALVAIGCWLVGDYVLAPAYPGFATRVLTSGAALVAFPLVLAALVGVGLPHRMYPRVVDACLVATAIAFTLVCVWEPAQALWVRILDVIQPGRVHLGDHGVADLVALPILAVSRWCYRATHRGR